MCVWKFVTEKGEKVHMRINERKKCGQGSGKITSQGSYYKMLSARMAAGQNVISRRWDCACLLRGL
jgi:hypothetical protein